MRVILSKSVSLSPFIFARYLCYHHHQYRRHHHQSMRGRLSYFIVLIMQIASWTCAASRPFATNDVNVQVVSVHQPGPIPQPAQVSLSPEGLKGWKRGGGISEEEYGRGVGSSPPSCENKCYGCVPCEATQVPTISHVGVQYANYEPEGWRCKCGPSFYSP